MIKKINEMLEDMNEKQLENVYNYVCNEYDEQDHEGNALEMIVKLTEENTRLKMKRKDGEII